MSFLGDHWVSGEALVFALLIARLGLNFRIVAHYALRLVGHNCPRTLFWTLTVQETAFQLVSVPMDWSKIMDSVSNEKSAHVFIRISGINLDKLG